MNREYRKYVEAEKAKTEQVLTQKNFYEIKGEFNQLNTHTNTLAKSIQGILLANTAIAKHFYQKNEIY